MSKRSNTKRLLLSKDKKIKLVKIKLKTRYNEYLKLNCISYFFCKSLIEANNFNLSAFSLINPVASA